MDSVEGAKREGKTDRVAVPLAESRGFGIP